MLVRRISGIAMFAMLILILVPLSTSASAASKLVFPVMNTSETLPDGVWFRNSPHTADTDRVTGHGVYAGDSVRLSCYAFGDAVGPYNDKLWYYVSNLTRPSVPATGAPNVGYLNAHYINDGMAANQVDAGVPQCGTPSPPPSIPEGASAFFLPKGHTTPSTANINDLYSTWAPGNCNYGGGVANPYNGRWVSILGGWSNGRLGPIYYLRYATSEQLSHIHYILLIDPGNASDMKSSCDANTSVSPSSRLASWLSLNQSNHLMILAASATGSDAGIGLTNYYLKTIQQRKLLNQVTVCWDDKLDHQIAFNKYAVNVQTSLMSHPSNSCPKGY